MTTQIPTFSLSQMYPQSFAPLGRTFIGGGALWLIYYGFQLLMGFTEGRASMDSDSIYALPSGFCFSGAIVGYCIGLFYLGTLSRVHSPAMTLIGQFFALLAAMSATVGLAKFVLTGEAPGMLGGIGVIGSCLSATFIAIAAKRTLQLPKSLSTLLLVIGLATFPLIVAFILPGQYVPAFLTDELPFALSGAAYIFFGRSLRKL